MANTKKLGLDDRKKAKRAKRRELKGKFSALKKTERKAFRKVHRSDKVTFVAWLKQRVEEKKTTAG